MFDAPGIVVSVWDIFTEHTILSLHIDSCCRVGEIVIFYDSTNSTLVKQTIHIQSWVQFN